MRPELDSTLHFLDDDMAQYSISSLLGDSLDSIKKAEFRQRTASSAAKIKEIVSEIREDVTVMEKRSRETTPTQRMPQLPVPVPVPADVRPDPVKQREQAARNQDLVLQYSPALKLKMMMEREKKVPKKAIVKRKFSLVHALPERPKKESHSYPSSVAPSPYSMHRLLASSPQQLQYHHLPFPPVSASLQYAIVVPTSLPYPTVSAHH